MNLARFIAGFRRFALLPPALLDAGLMPGVHRSIHATSARSPKYSRLVGTRAIAVGRRHGSRPLETARIRIKSAAGIGVGGRLRRAAGDAGKHCDGQKIKGNFHKRVNVALAEIRGLPTGHRRFAEAITSGRVQWYGRSPGLQRRGLGAGQCSPVCPARSTFSIASSILCTAASTSPFSRCRFASATSWRAIGW